MRIGVGVSTTTRRPDHFERWVDLLASDLFVNITDKYIAHDIDSVAKSKNECLRNLRECDYVFLFDDDCFPIKAGWEKIFIDAHNAFGCHHFSYLHNFLHVRKVGGKDGISTYNNSIGCMMFLTKDAIERVGAYDEGYGKYGYEHVDYSERVLMAGLAPARNICPDVAPEYIYSMDIDGWMKFDFKHHHTLTPDEMIAAEKTASEHISKRDDKIINIPL